MTTYRDLLTLSIGGYTAYRWSSTHPRSSWLWPEKQEGKVRITETNTQRLMHQNWKEMVQMADTLLSLPSLHSTYIFSLIIKSILHWRRKLFPRATVSHQQYSLPCLFRRTKKTKNYSEWQSLREECRIGGYYRCKPSFQIFLRVYARSWQMEEGNGLFI